MALSVSRGLWAVMGCAFAAIAQGQAPAKPMKHWFDQRKTELENLCTEAKQQPHSTTDEYRKIIERIQWVSNCDCELPEITVMAASEGARAKGSFEDAAKLLHPLTQRCGERGLRTYYQQLCELSPHTAGKAERAAYCRCAAAGLEQYSDEELAADSRALLDFQHERRPRGHAGRPDAPADCERQGNG